MKTLLALKRQILTASLLIGAATCVVTATCPLSTTSTTSTSSNAQSPENGGKKELILHNGHQICISVNAVSAHLKHGDTDLGPCSAPNKS